MTESATESVLIIGGGIAGITAALNTAEYGYKVYLVDDTPSIGGLMARLDKTFPTNDCSICIEAPKMYEVKSHENIEIVANADVRKVEAVDGHFKVRVLKRARFIDEEVCNACGKCVEKCPVTIPDELDARIGGTRKLISVPFPQAVPNMNYVNVLCRTGKMRDKGACVGACVVDCSQCRECGVALCVKACRDEGKGAIHLWQKDEWLDLEVKSIVVATGLAAAELEQGSFGYDVYPNVINYMNFERLMNSGGPTLGEIVRPSDGKHAHKIAWIQCAGRGDKGLNYCSKVCCMVAAKQTIITKEHGPETECTVFYNNQTCYGKGFDEFYKKASSLGVRYVIGKPFDVKEDPETHDLILRYEDEVEGTIKEERVELLVLSTGLVPNDRNARLAKVLKVDLDHHGFFKEPEPLKNPLDTQVPGVYLCGGATGPIDISESVVQATAASMKAVAKR
jgi:heterodisulfide reductase subunit A